MKNAVFYIVDFFAEEVGMEKWSTRRNAYLWFAGLTTAVLATGCLATAPAHRSSVGGNGADQETSWTDDSLYASSREHEQYFREHYTKHEYRIPMRDGVHLFTAVFAPKDTSREYPILLKRTPYSIAPYGEDRYPEYPWYLGPSMPFAKEGYIFVYQDVRGCFMSEGEFVNVRPHIGDKTSECDIDESSDTYDTIEWLLENIPKHNGRVGMWGISYPGFYA
ncbi:unnamed protein product, partial [marine sediment metagenome]